MGRLVAALRVAFAVSLVVLVCACGGGPERDPIRVQAATVDGQVIIVDDLGEQDTLLWFWAPW